MVDIIKNLKQLDSIVQDKQKDCLTMNASPITIANKIADYQKAIMNIRKVIDEISNI